MEIKMNKKNQRFFSPSFILKTRKGQVKIQQMAFMLIAIVIFFAFVGIFVLAFRLTSLKDTASLLEEQNAMLLVSKLADSPEFSCGQAFGGTRVNCIDLDKLMVLKQDISHYRSFWGVSNIEIRKVIGSGQQEITCTLSNYPNCNVLRLLENSSTGYDYSNFAALCWKEMSEAGLSTYDKCEVAKIIIRYKEKI